ncbi:hypothetical protein AC579_4206 [Pseudocercospora musae]|uniref:Uncharacterized protein n=1 Tax=Pseudocercospora musae TaxID=113226 RepID=A0A139IGN4_9PEZI|nr:hypothetical protein AC579_4206 [Pseudocercospora musae]
MSGERENGAISAAYCNGHSITVWSGCFNDNGWDSAGNSSILHCNRHHVLVNVHRHSTRTNTSYTFQHHYNTFIINTDNAFLDINMDQEHKGDTIEVKHIPTTRHQPANVQRLGRPAIATAMESSSPHKRAVIGGISGAIAGLVFIGLLICLVLRLLRKDHDSDLMSLTEKAEKTEPRPPLKQKLTELATVLPISRTARDSPRNSQLRPNSMSPVSVDEDHRIIRMSTRHWPRPFVPGAGEGYRDSAPLGQLRVVNPDLSRPTTPRRSTDTATSFLRKQREAFAGFVFTSPRPQSMVRITPNTLAQDVPTVAVVDPTLSREYVATYASTPSFRSYPSLTSLPTVQQYPAEDPFLTPTAETEKQLPALPHEQVPAMTSAAAAASKTWNSLGSLLHPFRARSNTATSQPATQVRGLSHFSVSTNASRNSRRSDPFDLDRPSIRDSTPARSGLEFHREGHAPGWILYEGT